MAVDTTAKRTTNFERAVHPSLVQRIEETEQITRMHTYTIRSTCHSPSVCLYVRELTFLSHVQPPEARPLRDREHAYIRPYANTAR